MRQISTLRVAGSNPAGIAQKTQAIPMLGKSRVHLSIRKFRERTGHFGTVRDGFSRKNPRNDFALRNKAAAGMPAAAAFPDPLEVPDLDQLALMILAIALASLAALALACLRSPRLRRKIRRRLIWWLTGR